MQEMNPLTKCFSLRLESNNVGAKVQVDIGGTTSVGNTQVIKHTIILEISSGVLVLPNALATLSIIIMFIRDLFNICNGFSMYHWFEKDNQKIIFFAFLMDSENCLSDSSTSHIKSGILSSKTKTSPTRAKLSIVKAATDLNWKMHTAAISMTFLSTKNITRQCKSPVQGRWRRGLL